MAIRAIHGLDGIGAYQNLFSTGKLYLYIQR